MNGKTFVDTNVLLYAYDRVAGPKQETARKVLHGLWLHKTGALSMQVLQEFYFNVTRKIASPLPKTVARRIVGTYVRWWVETGPAQIAMAFSIEDQARISFWDALIVASAHKSGASRIVTEDLNHGQVIAGIKIENPFIAPGSSGRAGDK
jgi:predicted nucleic acid-binding protein